jgi:uncharacterized protein
MRVFRVRHHGTIARIELGEKEMHRLWVDGIRENIVKHFKSLGYTYVSVDLEGYRTGSMNETLPSQQSSLIDPSDPGLDVVPFEINS